jgi:thiosulfate/3-mercaptopyruvate sulfurtransferase
MAGTERIMTKRDSGCPLVGVDELAEHVADPRWVIVDCRFDLTDPDAGRTAWRTGHVPGARYADLDRDLAAPVADDGAGGRHPLPDPRALQRLFRSWGVDASTRVVAYDDGANAFSARLWWLLRWLGHDDVAVLDGGLAAWQAAGHRLAEDEPPAGAGRFSASPGRMPVLDADAVAAGLAAGDLALLDARAPERYAGEVEPLDKRAGHVPGAINAPFQYNLGDDNCFRNAAALAAYYRAAIADKPRVAAMCGSGVTACHTLLALEIAGMPGAALYAGSWSDWISDGNRPVAPDAAGPD